MNKKDIIDNGKPTNSSNELVESNKPIASGWSATIKPKSIYDELAEAGYLSDYLKSYFPERMKQDAKFRENMVNVFYSSSIKYTPEVEVYCLEVLCECLEYFIEYNKKWLDQK